MPVADNAGGNQPQPSGDANQDFLGVSPDLELDAIDSPDPEASEVEEVEEAPADEPTEEIEAEAEETYELPDEQAKVFPTEEINKFGKHRYGYTPEEIAADPRLQRSLKDQLNSAILIEQHKSADAARAEEPTLEADESAAEIAPATQNQTPEQRSQWLEQVYQQAVDPKVAEEWGKRFFIASGVDPKDEATLKHSASAGKEMVVGAIDLISTLLPQFLPQLLPNVIEQTYPEFGQMHGASLYNLAWESVRSSRPEFSSLPAYSAKGFKEALTKAQAEIPGFEDIKFSGNAYQQAQKFYGLLAKHMSGGRITAADVAKGVETGKQQAAKALVKKVAARALGSGQSTQQFAQKGTDPAMDDLDAVIAASNRDQDPFASR